MPQSRSGLGTRPTTDRVRESLFNVLAGRVEFAGASVLDLYAGSGALGLEALSRGASSAVFVEADSRAAAVIAQNIASLGVAGGWTAPGTVVVVERAASSPALDWPQGWTRWPQRRYGDTRLELAERD